MSSSLCVKLSPTLTAQSTSAQNLSRRSGHGEIRLYGAFWKPLKSLNLSCKSTIVSGYTFPGMRHLSINQGSGLEKNILIKPEKSSSKKNLSCWFYCCATGGRKDADAGEQLSDVRVIYCVAPALGHDMEAHPETNLRVPAITSALEKLELTPKHRGSDIMEVVNYKSATVDDIATVHSKSYVSLLEKVMDLASREGLIYLDRGNTYATSTTYHESLIAAGAGISLVDSVVAASRFSNNPPVGFALVRPPGHHAIPEGPMGFCVFGNLAVAARHVQRVHGLKRVFIIDFDVHHGNGTSDVFYDDPDIFFLSTHEDGSYPGTGKIDEIGYGSGEGTALNLPLPRGSGDTAMRRVFDEIIVPSAQKFKPDIILVSAGYDAHVLDPLASFQFTTHTYHMLASNIKQLATELCKGRCVFFLEGGYNLESLSYSVADSFQAFLGEPSLSFKFDDPAILYEEPSEKVRQAIRRVKHIHSL